MKPPYEVDQTVSCYQVLRPRRALFKYAATLLGGSVLPMPASALTQPCESPSSTGMVRRVCLAVEGTHFGAGPNGSLVEIGAIELVGEYPTGKTIQMFLNPPCDIHEFMIEEIGLTKKDLVGKPIFSEIAAKLVAFIANAALVTRDKYAIEWLDLELSRCGQPSVGLICTSLEETFTMYRSAHANETPEAIREGLRSMHEINMDMPIQRTLEKACVVARAYLALKP